MRSSLILTLILAAPLFGGVPSAPETGERLVLLGGGLGERMLYFHHFETELHVRFPDADLIVRKPPRWDPDGGYCDMYYWYYGTYALFQMGGKRWKFWERALETAVRDTQIEEGDARGSWDPVGPWGYIGGRVYSTALMTMCLQVHYRYSQLLGSR